MLLGVVDQSANANVGQRMRPLGLVLARLLLRRPPITRGATKLCFSYFTSAPKFARIRLIRGQPPGLLRLGEPPLPAISRRLVKVKVERGIARFRCLYKIGARNFGQALAIASVVLNPTASLFVH